MSAQMDVFTPAFHRLESDFLELSRSLWIDEAQLDVYSPLAAEILLRAGSEVEALARELYQRENPNPKPRHKNPSFDSTCLRWLEEEWSIHRRQVIVTNSSVYLENRALHPLFRWKRRLSSRHAQQARENWTYVWNQPYQAIKHDRANSFKVGTIRHALQALAAQYLLWVCWIDPQDKISGLQASAAHGRDMSFNSQLFAVKSTGRPEVSISRGVNFNVERRSCSIELVPDTATVDFFTNVAAATNTEFAQKKNEIITERLRNLSTGEGAAVTSAEVLESIQKEIVPQVEKIDRSALVRNAVESMYPNGFDSERDISFSVRLNRMQTLPRTGGGT